MKEVLMKKSGVAAPVAAFIDDELEKSVLVGISTDADTFFRYAGDVLSPECFVSFRDRYKELVDAFSNGLPMPTLPAATLPADLEAAVKKLADIAQRRKAAEVVSRFWTDLGAGAPVHDILSSAIENLLSAQQVVKSLSPGRVCSFSELLSVAESDFTEKAALLTATGRPTAHPSFGPELPEFTETLGGLQPGVFAVSGLPGVGKTFLMLTWAHRYIMADDDTAVVWVDVQETRPLHKLALRLACIHARKNPYAYERALADPAELEMIVKAALAQLGERFAVVDASQNTSISHIRGAIRRVMAQTGAKKVMVVVDYIQKMAFTAGGGDFQDIRLRIGNIVTGLTGLVKIANGPVIMISSVSKDAYRRGATGATLADFKESGGVEFTADVGIQLRWANDVRNDDIDSAVKVIDAHVLKNRFGPSGVIRLYSVRDEARYTEADPGDRMLPSLTVGSSISTPSVKGDGSGMVWDIDEIIPN
jgi:replicative DNA helicase